MSLILGHAVDMNIHCFRAVAPLALNSKTLLLCRNYTVKIVSEVGIFIGIGHLLNFTVSYNGVQFGK